MAAYLNTWTDFGFQPGEGSCGVGRIDQVATLVPETEVIGGSFLSALKVSRRKDSSSMKLEPVDSTVLK